MKSKKRYRLIAGLLLLFAATACAAYWWRLNHSHEMQYKATRETARFRALQLAELQANSFEALFHSFDMALVRFRDHLQTGANTIRLQDIRKLKEALPEDAQAHMMAIDSGGYLLFSTAHAGRSGHRRLYLGDKAFFKEQQGTAQDKRQVSGPVTLPPAQRPSLVISRPLLKNGVFAGVVTINLSVEYLSVLLGKLQMAEKDNGALLTADGTFLARSNLWGKAIGTKVPSARPFLSPQSRPNGTYHVTAHVDGVLRTFAWHKLKHFPLIVTMGLSDESVLAPVDRLVKQNINHSLIGTSVAVILMLMIAGMLEWVGRQQAHIEMSESRFRLIFNAMSEGIIFRDLHGNVVAANPAAERIYDLPHNKLIGENLPIAGRSLLKENGSPYSADDHPAMLALRTGQPVFNQIAMIQNENQVLRYINLNAIPVLDDTSARSSSVLVSFSDITNLKHTENALRRSEQASREQSQRLSEIIWGTSTGTWEWDIPTDALTLNEHGANMIGYTLNEIAPLTFEQFKHHVHPDDLARATQLLQAYFEHQHDAYECEMRMRHKNGRWVWILTRGRVAQWNDDGKPLRMSGTHQDISTRKATEQALQESQSRLTEIFDSVNDAIIIAEPENCAIVDVNHRMCEMYGFTRDEVVKDRLFWQNATPPFSAREAAVKFREVIKTGAQTFEWLAYRKDGSAFWVEINVRPARIGKRRRVICVARDITERRKYEEKLRLAASVFARSYEGIMVTDANNTVIDVNPAFSRITGYAREEIIGKTPSLLSSGYHSEAFYHSMWRTLKEKEHWNGEIWNRHKDGSIFAEMLSIATIRDPGGRLSNYVGVFTDISQLKEHEAELVRISHYDPLTGAPNRRLLADRLQQAVLRTKRNGNHFAVCCLDLDGFKPVNDQFGHEAGDQVLITVVQRIQSVLRPDDSVARLGGDEFVLLISDLDSPEEAFAVLDRILSEIRSPIALPQGTAQVSASIGMAFSPPINPDPDVLLRQADQAMYAAKEKGRDRYCLFSS